MQPLEIKGDPRQNVAQADLQKQLDLLLQIRDQVSKVDEAINKMNSVKKQVDDLDKRMPQDDQGKAVRDASRKLLQKMNPIEDTLIQSKAKSGQDVLNYPIRLNNELTALAGTIATADSAPAEQAYTVFNLLKQRSDEQLAQWNEFVSSDLVSFNQLVRQQDVQAIILDSSGTTAGTQSASSPNEREEVK